MIARCGCTLLLALLLGACAVNVPRIEHLQLSADGVQPGSGDTPVLYLDAIQMPDFLLRSELLLRIDEHRLDYHPTQRWAEPLDIAIQRILARRLSALLDSAAVRRYPRPRPGVPHASVNIAIDHFEVQGNSLRLLANATIRSADGAPPRTLQFAREIPAPQDAPGIAAGMSEMLRELAGELAAALVDGGAGADSPG